MEAIGAARRVDALGRVVLPADLRRFLGINEGDLLDVRAVDGRVVISKILTVCAICGGEDPEVQLHEKPLCLDCVAAIKAFE